MASFQTQVGYNPAPAVEGDFASANPRANVLAGPGALIAGSAGVRVGRFAWLSYAFADGDGAPGVVNNFGSGPVAGFIHRVQQGLITDYLQAASMLVPAGNPITVHNEGDFWIRNAGAAAAQYGMKVFANFADGTAFAAAAGSSSGAASGSASSIAAATSAFTGSIAGNVLTVTAVGSGVVRPGTTISGTNVATGTKVVSQLSGTPGGIGTYAVSIPDQDVDAGTAISGTYGILTVGGTVVGLFAPGQILSGSGVATGTTVTQLITGTGGSGSTLAVDNNTVVGSTAISAQTNIETKWTVRSFAAPGEIMKMGSWPQG